MPGIRSSDQGDQSCTSDTSRRPRFLLSMFVFGFTNVNYLAVCRNTLKSGAPSGTLLFCRFCAFKYLIFRFQRIRSVLSSPGSFHCRGMSRRAVRVLSVLSTSYAVRFDKLTTSPLGGPRLISDRKEWRRAVVWPMICTSVSNLRLFVGIPLLAANSP